MEQRSNRHIILVISDGEPSGANRNGYDHLKKVVKFCRNNGAEVYAFGIATKSPRIFYGEENFVFLPSIKDMNGHFFRQLSNIIVQGSMVK
jgi:cobalamin biosynthesis protein CobT